MCSYTLEPRFLIFPHLWCHISWDSDRLNERFVLDLCLLGLMFKRNIVLKWDRICFLISSCDIQQERIKKKIKSVHSGYSD